MSSNITVIDNIALQVSDNKLNKHKSIKDQDNDNDKVNCIILDKNLLPSKLDVLPFRKKRDWVKDSFCLNCHSCAIEFNMFTRKHHCRYCGKIFCHSCTINKVNIPTLKNITGGSEKERVCEICFHHITKLKKFVYLYILLGNLPLDCHELRKCKILSRNWNYAHQYYQSTLDYIQNDANETKYYSHIEWNLIWTNRYIYIGHISWKMKLIQYIEKKSIKNEKEIVDILYGSRKFSCENLKCSYNCGENLSFIQALTCLNSDINIENNMCEKFILDIFWQADLSEYLCFFPVIMNMATPAKHNLTDYLISISCHHYELANILFWGLSFLVQNLDSLYLDFYEELRLKFIDKMESETRDHLQNSYYFIENLKQICEHEDFPILIKSYLKTHKESSKLKISCPLNITKFIVDVDNDNIVVKGSQLKPIIIPFIDNNNEKYPIMIKKDDLRKDYIIMNIIKLIDKIIKDRENLDLYITTYNILPISLKFGLIEIVDDAETIYHINKKSKFSILNYILEHNNGKSVQELRERFTKSCVGYCLISYLLGIGDRHLENIMIKKSGEIFHIDFGFVLGYDPKFMSPEIRLTFEMVDAMGGKNSKYYELFKTLWAKCILRLRNHITEIKLLLYCLTYTNPPIDKNITKEYIDKFIDSKFMIGQDFNQISLHLIKKIDNSSKLYSGHLIDFCHNTVTQDSKTVMTESANYSSAVYKYISKLW